MSKSSSAEWPFSFCDVVNCSRKRHLTSAVQLLSLLFLHLALFLSRLWKQKAQSKNTNFPSWKLNFAFFAVHWKNFTRRPWLDAVFMTVKQKAKNHQIDQFFYFSLMIIANAKSNLNFRAKICNKKTHHFFSLNAIFNFHFQFEFRTFLAQKFQVLKNDFFSGI